MRRQLLLGIVGLACLGPAASTAQDLPAATDVLPTKAALPAEPPAPPLKDGGFVVLEPGLELGRFRSEVAHPVGDGAIHVLRIDPGSYDIVARVASRDGARWLGAEGWARQHDLLAVINSSMFHPDGRSVFMLVDGDHKNSATWKSGANNLLVADRRSGAPGARILDTTCEDRASNAASYRTQVQSWRLLDCAGKPTWKRNHKIWSHALIGQDKSGRILFIHARTPWNTRVFTDILLALPLELERLQYAEGGPESSLYVSAGGFRAAYVGSYETDFTEHDNNRMQWNLPNVVGVKRRATPPAELR